MPREERVRGQLDLTTPAATSFYWAVGASRRVNEQRRDSMSTHHTNRLFVQAIDPIRLDAVRTTGADGHGNQLRPFAATGRGEPLRCCLRYAEPGEQITL